MGDYTTLVLVGFLAAHCALILNITSVSTPYWIETESNSTGNSSSNTTQVHKGLFVLCTDQECDKLNGTAQLPYWKAVQGLSVVSGGAIILGLLGTYSVLLISSLEGALCPIWSLSFYLISGFSSLTVAILFPLRYTDEQDISHDLELRLGWSYWLMVAVTTLSFITIFTTVRHLSLLTRRHRGYQDI